MQHQNYLKQVRDQYEDYPYPYREPEGEKTRILPTIDLLEAINHFCYEGKEDFSNNYKVLVAGGGTGDSIIFMAEQLRDTNAELVYLDMSEASMNIAKKRAEIRGLSNITWIHDSLLELPNLDIGTFDYINCSGVLHHLEDPDAGLAALTSVLKDDGVICLMVYEQYGRTGLYHMQDLMQLVNEGETNTQTKIDNCKTILKSLPKHHWYSMTSHLYIDIDIYGDIGIYDLFLHTQDRAYTVPELYDYIENAGLTMQHYNCMDQQMGQYLLKPDSFLKDEGLATLMKELEEKDQLAINENLFSATRKHICFITKEKRPIPTTKDMQQVPFFVSGYNPSIYQDIYTLIQKATNHVEITFHPSTKKIRFPKTPHIELLCKYFDGNRSIEDIINAVLTSYTQQKKAAPDTKTLHKEFTSFFDLLNSQYWGFLRHKSVPAFKSIASLQEPITAKYQNATDNILTIS